MIGEEPPNAAAAIASIATTRLRSAASITRSRRYRSEKYASQGAVSAEATHRMTSTALTAVAPPWSFA